MTPRPPSAAVLSSFGAAGHAPVRFESGEGTTWRAGPIILKPEKRLEWMAYVAALFEALPDNPAFRFARPCRAASGAWLEDGWSAWTFIEGVPAKGRVLEKLRACDALHKAVASAPRAPLLNAGEDAWSAADRVAWQEQDMDFHPALDSIVAEIRPHLQPLALPAQAVHGDMTGNFLFAEQQVPAIIDFSPYWRPAGFAQAIILSDVIAWEDAGAEVFSLADIPHMRQLVLRAAYRRIAEQQAHMTYPSSPFHHGNVDGIMPLVNGYARAVRLLLDTVP